MAATLRCFNGPRRNTYTAARNELNRTDINMGYATLLNITSYVASQLLHLHDLTLDGLALIDLTAALAIW